MSGPMPCRAKQTEGEQKAKEKRKERRFSKGVPAGAAGATLDGQRPRISWVPHGVGWRTWDSGEGVDERR